MQRKSAIGHTGLPFNCPHTEALASEVVSLLELNNQSRVLDLGCGKAELLTRICETYSCRGTGVDSNSAILSLARQPTSGDVQLIEKDMTVFVEDNDSTFDAVICIGSIREGQQESTIAKVTSFLNKGVGVTSTKGSCLLIGELVWVKPPSVEFLDYLGMKETDYCTLEQLKLFCQDNGMEVIFSTSQSLEVYETKILNNIEEWAASPGNSSDPEYDVIVGRSRDWHKFSKENAWHTWEFATILVRMIN
jgi:SAM-dependent methyltransferase